MRLAFVTLQFTFIAMRINLISLQLDFLVLQSFHCDTARFRFVAVQLHCDADRYAWSIKVRKSSC